MDKNSWISDSERTLLASPVMTLVERKAHSSEDGRPFTFYVLRSRDWCNIIPVTADGKVVLVRQHRAGINAHTVEIPGGVADATDPDPAAAAVRELAEETGYVPLPQARVETLGWTHPNPAILDNRCHSFIVGPVQRTQEPQLDAGEMIETLEVPIAELPAWIRDGKVTHALMLNAFLFLLLRDRGTAGALAHQLEAFVGR